MLFHHLKSLDILWATFTSILSPLKDPISTLPLQYYSPIFTLVFQVVLSVQICKLQCPTWLQIGVESKLSFLIFLICVLQEMPHNYTLFMKQLLSEPYYLHVLKSGSLNLLEPPWPVQACTGISSCYLNSLTTCPHSEYSMSVALTREFGFDIWTVLIDWLIAIGFETSRSRCT
jgi:hypothetical protein